jgi:hypothetical protein
VGKSTQSVSLVSPARPGEVPKIRHAGRDQALARDEVGFPAFVDEPNGRLFIAHIETQTSRDPEMTNRMLARYPAIWRWAAERREFKDAYIRPTVLYLGSARWKPKTVIDEFKLRFEHGFVAARDLDPDPLLASDNLGDVAFAVLCRGGNRPVALRRTIERIVAAPAEERRVTAGSLVALSDLRGIGDAALLGDKAAPKVRAVAVEKPATLPPRLRWPSR